MRQEIDPITTKAIEALESSPRASFAEIARRIGASRLAVASRLRPLLDDGSLRVIGALHPLVHGWTTAGHVSIRVSGDRGQLIDMLLAMPSVVFVSETTGQAQITAELYASSIPELSDRFADIRSHPATTGVEALVYSRLLAGFFPERDASLPATELDDVDRRIAERLQTHGRESLVALASCVGQSISATRTRVARLIDSGTLQLGVVRGRSTSRREFVIGIGLHLHGSARDLLETLRAEAGLEFLVETIGRFDAVATVSSPNLDRHNALAASLQQLDCVVGMEQWLHANIHLERYLHGA